MDLSKEFLSEGFLNFSLIVVNILIPAGVVVEQLVQNNKEAKEEAEVTPNPLGADGAEDSSQARHPTTVPRYLSYSAQHFSRFCHLSDQEACEGAGRYGSKHKPQRAGDVQ